MLIDLEAISTQQALADLVGVTQQAISSQQLAGHLPAGVTLRQALLAYCERLREQAAGRVGSEPGALDLAQERAALAREQRKGIEIKNAVLRGQYADVALLAEVLATASQAVAQRFDHLPGRLRKVCPDLPTEAIDQVMAVVAAARNEWATQTAELVSQDLVALADDADEADDDPGPSGLQDDEPPAA